MKDLKQKLIRLGSEKPSLRKHLRPILDRLTKESSLSKLSSVAGAAQELVKYLNSGGDVGSDWYYTALDRSGADLYFDENLTAEEDLSNASDVFVLVDGQEKYTVEYDERNDIWREVGSLRRSAHKRRQDMLSIEKDAYDTFYELYQDRGMHVEQALDETATKLDMSDWDLIDTLQELGVPEVSDL